MSRKALIRHFPINSTYIHCFASRYSFLANTRFTICRKLNTSKISEIDIHLLSHHHLKVNALTPAEQMFLLDPKRTEPKEVVKVTLMSLVARGVISMDVKIEQRLFFGVKRTSTLRVLRTDQVQGPHEAALLQAVRAVSTSEGATIAAVVKEVKKIWGTDARSFVNEFIAPSLIRRRLIEENVFRLFLFISSRFVHTSAGLAEKQRIEGLIERAKQIPDLIESHPKTATTIALAAGDTLLLVPELYIFHNLLAALHADKQQDVGSSMGSDEPSSTLQLKDLTTEFSQFDLEALDSFDSNFDGGGDSGGGDGD